LNCAPIHRGGLKDNIKIGLQPKLSHYFGAKAQILGYFLTHRLKPVAIQWGAAKKISSSMEPSALFFCHWTNEFPQCGRSGK
jgi:hypothetical protein